jgi:protein-L-isoaspartate(D-aspartate) O-methyltransferase
MIDAAVQRKNMVESQVRPSDVTDRRIPRAMLSIPREQFVPPHLKSLAYIDNELPLTSSRDGARALMAPRTFAKLVQLAELGETDLVLDVGCATGYSAAVLATLAQTVVALECDPGLAAMATRTLAAFRCDTVAVVTGDLAHGYPKEGPYDAILVEGAVASMPRALLEQLRDGGRLVAILVDGGVSQAVRWRRLGETFDRIAAFDAAAPLLPGFEPASGFVL